MDLTESIYYLIRGVEYKLEPREEHQRNAKEKSEEARGKIKKLIFNKNKILDKEKKEIKIGKNITIKINDER